MMMMCACDWERKLVNLVNVVVEHDMMRVNCASWWAVGSLIVGVGCRSLVFLDRWPESS